MASGILSEGEIAPATRDVLKNSKNVSVELAEVTGFDLKARHISAVYPGGRKVTLSYNSLIVAAGVGQSYFGHDEFSKWAPGMKTLADALEQRARIFGAFEMAELEDDPEVRRAWLPSLSSAVARPASRSQVRSRSCQGGRSSAISANST